jgi:hypothetical protein
MYEINIRNLKIYLVVLSLIFFLTNGVPLLHIFEKNDNIYINNNQDTRNYNTLKGDNFIIVNDNSYYTINATVIKHSLIYTINTNYITGSVILQYINYIDNHHYCKINIDIPEQKHNTIIYEFIYKYYNLSRNNIQLHCNDKDCIHKLYKYENEKYADGKLEDIKCNILTFKQFNDEL